jgi:DNA (cytosine-5)-methyltransferase 1
MQAFGEYSDDGTASAMKARDYKDATDLAVLYENHPNDSRVTGPHDVAPSCVSRFGTGGGNVPLVQEAVAFTTEQTPKFNKEQALTLTKQSPSGGGQPQCVMAVDVYNQTIDGDVAATLTEAVGGTNTSGAKVMAFHQNASGEVRESESVYALNTNSNPSGRNTGMIQSKMAVRRLTPRECERLQGFPDDHTLIPWRNKPADQCPDGPRYKALGNSMAVPCMKWIGKRIARAENERQRAA